MGMRFDLDILGEQQISREILRTSRRSMDGRPVFTALADDFLRMERKQFESEGQYASGGWAPLAPSTLRRKRAKGYDERRLHEGSSGELALRNSLTKKGHSLGIRKITPSEMTVGTRVRYAIVHQKGTDRIPRRRPVEFPEKRKRTWVKTIQRWLIEGRVRFTTAGRLGD